MRESSFEGFAVIRVSCGFQVRQHVLLGQFEVLPFPFVVQLSLRFLRLFAWGFFCAIFRNLGFHILAFPTPCHAFILPHEGRAGWKNIKK